MTVLEDTLLDFFDFCVDFIQKSFDARLIIADYSIKEEEEWDNYSEDFNTLDMCSILAFLRTCTEYYRRGYVDWEEDKIDDDGLEINVLRLYRTHAQRE